MAPNFMLIRQTSRPCRAKNLKLTTLVNLIDSAAGENIRICTISCFPSIICLTIASTSSQLPSCSISLVAENNTKLYSNHYQQKTRQSSIARIAMLRVDRRARLRAWVSSLVAKSGLACCENARINKAPQPDTPIDFRSLNYTFSIPSYSSSAWKVRQSWRNPH